jgi:hypothetical protein
MSSPYDYFLIGLFMGEGHVAFSRRRNRKRPERFDYRPELIMRLRSDDRPLLEFLKAQWGGQVIDVYVSPTSGNPMSQWYLTGFQSVEPILDLIIGCFTALVPCEAKKMLEVIQLKAICLRRKELPYFLGDEHRKELALYYDRMKVIRRYQSAG